jgi:hypothetical protein
MGYSIMVEFPSTELRDQMFKFLESNMTDLGTLTNDLMYTRGPVTDPAYCLDSAKDRLIGYDFSLSGDLQSRMAYLVCYWIIKRVPGTKFWYDGSEPWGIPKECDDDGFHTLARIEHLQLKSTKSKLLKKLTMPQIKYIERFDPIIKGELQRLTKLYNETFNTKQN